MNIREYEEEDWSHICEVHDLARPEELSGSCDYRAFVALDNTSEKEDLFNSRLWVAEEEGEVVGFVGVEKNCISWLYVHPAFQRRGIGRALFRVAVAHAGKDVFLSALAGNHKALKLYESEGFYTIRTTQGKIQSFPCHSVVMAPKSNLTT